MAKKNNKKYIPFEFGNKNLPKGPYKANEEELKVLNFWLKNKFYKPEYDHNKDTLVTLKNLKEDTKDTFCIVNPPPNAYGRPHLGNVSGYAYQDLMLRFNRMLGKKVYGQPGKDHAGIQGEIVVLREYFKKQGKTKQNMTRDEFYQKTYQYFLKIKEQAKKDEQRIGLSSDFDRDTFTLDPNIVKIVLETFIKMYKDKMVYKGVRIINWCPSCKTTLADIDTERKERLTQFSYIRYPLLEEGRKVWELNFNNKKILETLIKEEKTIETRALNPEEKNRYFRNIKQNDIIIAIDKSNKSHQKRYPFIVKGVKIYRNLKELHKQEDLEKIFPNTKITSLNDLKKLYLKFKNNYLEKIDKNGIIAIKLERYKPAKHTKNFITVATTRPETMLGDTAVVVNPNDKRYKSFINKKLLLPLVWREIPIISDPIVDKNLGTGALKLTPSHAPEDYEIMLNWNKNNPSKQIDYINVINKEAKMCGPVGKYFGLNTDKCKNEVLNDLKSLKLLEKQEEKEQFVSICERCKSITEPQMSSQWFIKVKNLKRKAIQVVKKEEIKIHPKNMTKVYLDWLENLRDWPISRSLWWGYRFPIWYKGKLEEKIDENGKIINTINKKPIKNFDDAIKKGLAKIQIDNPNPKIILIPGLLAPEVDGIYTRLKNTYPNVTIINTGKIKQTYDNYKELLDKVDLNNSIVVAHSLGCVAIIDYLTENDINLKSLILISPSTKNSKYYNIFKKIGFWRDTDQIQTIHKKTDELFMIYSDNDEFFTKEDFEDFAKTIKATPILEPNKKHFWTPFYDYNSKELEKLLNKYTQSRWIQDESVFDTWFSSGQWAYAPLMKWELFDKFYPTNVMETGYDILRIWVSRMVMLGLYKTGKIPFKDVYLHGLIKSFDGQKMSKSKGNIVEPDKIINEYGADVLRLFYIAGNKAGANYQITNEKLVGNKRFLNKLWNASRFVMFNIEDNKGKLVNLTKNDFKFNQNNKKVIDNIDKLVAISKQKILEFKFGIVIEEIMQNFWHIFCDIHLEECKKNLYTKDKNGNPINYDKELRLETQWTILYSLKEFLKILHPFIPFITERIWQAIPKSANEKRTIMYESIQ